MALKITYKLLYSVIFTSAGLHLGTKINQLLFLKNLKFFAKLVITKPLSEKLNSKSSFQRI